MSLMVVYADRRGLSSATQYKCRAKYLGMDVSLIGEMKAMAECRFFG